MRYSKEARHGRVPLPRSKKGPFCVKTQGMNHELNVCAACAIKMEEGTRSLAYVSVYV